MAASEYPDHSNAGRLTQLLRRRPGERRALIRFTSMLGADHGHSHASSARSALAAARLSAHILECASGLTGRVVGLLSALHRAQGYRRGGLRLFPIGSQLRRVIIRRQTHRKVKTQSFRSEGSCLDSGVAGAARPCCVGQPVLPKATSLYRPPRIRIFNWEQ